MEFAPDGRLFALEQGGNVEARPRRRHDLTALHLNVDSHGERGLLGIAFDPNYSSNHFVYLYYTNPNPGAAPWATGEHNQLSRFTVDDSNPQQPVFTSEAPILDWDNLSAATNHNGGRHPLRPRRHALCRRRRQRADFHPGREHVPGLADPLRPPGQAAPHRRRRFNGGVATRDDTAVGHLIPADNPFVGTAPGINQLIYALGLRNPFTFAVQPGTGTIFINDVGERPGGDRPERRWRQLRLERRQHRRLRPVPARPRRLSRPAARLQPLRRPGRRRHRHRRRRLLRPGHAAIPGLLRRQVFLRRPGRWLDPRVRSRQPGQHLQPRHVHRLRERYPGQPGRPQGGRDRQPLLPIPKRRSDQQDLLCSPGHGHVPEAGLRRRRATGWGPTGRRATTSSTARPACRATPPSPPRARTTTSGRRQRPTPAPCRPRRSSRIAATWWTTTSFAVDVEPHRRPGARPGAVLPRLGPAGADRAGADQRRDHRRGAEHADGLIVPVGRVPGLRGERERRDHDHQGGGDEQRPQRPVPRPGDHGRGHGHLPEAGYDDAGQLDGDLRRPGI